MAKQNPNINPPKDYESFKEWVSQPVDYNKNNRRVTLDNLNNNNQIVLQSTLKKQQETFNPVQYDTPNEAIFHRYSDGTYQAKFENYLGATGNEDRLGQLQSGWEQLGYGLVKNARKMGNYVLDATIGTLAGITKSIGEGSLSGFWNNDVSKTLDEWNQSLDYKLPNYYTNEQRSMGVLRSLGTANFWGNDVAGGLAFVGGALIPEIALGIMTGGATISGGLAKIGLKSALKSTAKKGLKEGAEQLFDPTNYTNLTKAKLGYTKQGFSTEKFIQSAQKASELDGGLDLMKASQKVKRYATAGNVLDTGLFITRTSGFEAGMEARHNFNESVENYVNNFEAENGRTPTAEEIGKFTNDAVNVANGVFGFNMGVLGVSNYAMFGKTLGIKTSKITTGKNFFNSAIGLGVEKSTEDAAKLALKGANRAQKITGSAYKIFSKPLVEGVYEEGLQGVIGKTMQNYMEGKYSKDKDATLDFSSSLFKSFGEQYGTKEGWKEMTVGMIIGFTGGPIVERSYKALPGFGNNSRKAAQEALGKDVDKVNTGVSILRNMNRASSAANFRTEFENRASQSKRSTFEESNINMAFIQSQESLKSLNTIKNDFNKVMDESDFNDLNLGDGVEDYKNQLKENFANDVTHYQNAKNLVSNLNLADLQIGKQFEVKDYMTALFFNAGKSTERAKSIANEIDSLTGESGTYNSLNVLVSFNKEQLDIVEKLNQNRTKIEELKDLAMKYSTDFSVKQTDRTRSEKYKEYAQKVAITQKRIVELEGQNRKLADSIESLNNVQTDLNFGDSIESAGAINTLEAVDQVSKLETYINKLNKAGRTAEAEKLETLLDDFKTNVGTSLQASIEASKITKGVYSKILGPEFKIKDDVREEFAAKEEVLRRSFNSVFTGVNFDLDEYLDELENNPDLSPREKYKKVDQLRMLLSLDELERITEEAGKSLIDTGKKREAVDIQKVVPGSTVFIKRDGSDTFEAGEITEQGTVKLANEEEIGFDQVTEAEAYAKEEPTNQKLKVEEVEQKRFKSLSATKSAANISKINSEFDKRYLELLDKQEISPKSALESLYLNGRQNSRVFKKIQKDNNILFNNIFIDVVDGITIPENLDITNSDTIGKVIEDTLIAIEDIRRGEVKTTPEAEKLQIEIASLQLKAEDLKGDQDSAELLKEIQDLISEKKLELRSKSYTPVSILESNDFKRFSELSIKEDRNPQEEEEYQQLKAEIDDWTLISGITISGVNLSDLIEQKSFLDSLNTEELPNIEQPIFKEVVSPVNAAEKSQRSNYTFGLGYYSVMASKGIDGAYTLNYINPQAFLQEIGVDIFTNDSGTYIFDLGGEMHAITRDYLGNLVLSPELVQSINRLTNIRILSTSDGTYSVVYKFNSEGVGFPLKSNFNIEYNKDNQPADESVVYQTQENEAVSFELDPLDDYNGPLFDAYKKALKSKDENKIKDAKTNIQNSAVVRVVNSKGQTLQFLKGNRTQEGDRVSKEDLEFIAMRIEALDSDDTLSKAANTKTIQELPIKGVKVKKVLIGHPTLSLEQDQNNLDVVSTFKSIRKEDVSKILTIGYIEDGITRLRDSKINASTQLVTKLLERSTYTKGKTPVVVLSKAGKNFIYPVKTKALQATNIELLSDIFYSETMTDMNKAVKLNKILFENGIDANVKGNAFVAIGVNNLTEEFFNEKLNQLVNSERYDDVSKWLDSNSNLENIVTQEILLNLNINDPIHSPKIEFSYEDVQLKEAATTTVARNVKTKNTADENVKTIGKVSKLKELTDRINKKASEKLDENC